MSIKPSFWRALPVLAATCTFMLAAHAQESLVIASYGGEFQDVQRKVFFEPFTKATGIKVVEASGISVAKVKSMVMTKNVEWDVFITSAADFAQLVEGNFLEDIDYSKMDKKVLDQLDQGAVRPKVLGTQWTSQVIAYNTKAFPGDNHPKSWADVWNVQKFPGPRILPAGNYAINPIEPALLSAGGGKDSVYPIDLDKAYTQLDKIRPNVIRWVNSGSAVPQALVDGEAVAGYANSQRIQQLKDKGAPVDYVWNEGLISMSFWAMPKGAKNKAAAFKFLEFASRAEQQANLAKNSIGPVNKGAFALLTPAENARLPSAPANIAQQVRLRPEEWLKPGKRGKTIYDDNLARWVAWSAGTKK
jgi:putative spermidine/putrescine transport system substrate-binding protein